MSRGPLLAGAVAAVVASPLLLVGLAMSGAAADDPAPCAPAQASQVADLDSEQARNAGVIVTVGQAAAVPAFGLQIALATAMQESTMRNLPYGDRDSLGLFQQRPSAGWGTAAQVQDPVYAAQAFFGGSAGPNSGEPPGLLDIAGWEDMPLTVAAQAVQLSAFPHAYARWETAAAAWLGDLLGMLAAEEGLTQDALRVLRCVASHFPQVTTFHGVGDRAKPRRSRHQVTDSETWTSGPSRRPSSDPPEQPRVTLPSGLRQLAAAIRKVEAWGDNVPLDVGAPSPRPVLRIAPGGRAARSRASDDGDW